MLTFYTIILCTRDKDDNAVEEQYFAAHMEEAESILCRTMNQGDEARVYQTDCRPPANPEEAVEWLRNEPEFSLLMLVATATRTSEYEAPNITPVEIKGFVFAPAEQINA